MEPRDCIAALALVCCTVLMLAGQNHTVTWAFGGIIGAYVLSDIVLFREGNIAQQIRDRNKKDSEGKSQ